jgi:hypothetical protein
LITVGRDTPTDRAVADVPTPSAIVSTIHARSRWPAEIVEERVQDSNVARSWSLSGPVRKFSAFVVKTVDDRFAGCEVL